MTDILDLPGWTVLGKRLDGAEYELEAEYTVQPAACQKCGVLDRLYKHGTKLTTFRDSPIRGHATRILARVRRYKCRECGETFLQPMGGIQEDMRMTERCAAFIKQQCLRDTFVRIADNIGCDDKTVRSLAGDHIAAIGAGYRPALPAWLGIDETQIDGKMRCVITDIGAHRPIEMLAERDKGTLTTWLNHYRDRSHVQGVAIDMWRPYRDVARHMLPGVPVVIDKFHVVRTASYCMERVRIRLQKVKKSGERRDWLRSKALLNMRYGKLTEKQRFNVDMWLDNEPTLKAAHGLKEAFYGIYDMPKAQAVAAYDGFAATIPADLKADFKVLTTSMKNWRREILAYFDHPISNAYTEALNGVAKTINRAGRGYSFDVLRARLLFGKGLPPQQAPTPEPLKMDPTRRISQMERRHAIAAAGNRCQSCGGVFEPAELQIHQTLPLVAGEHRKVMVVCRPCHERFHTSALTHTHGRSTS
jgi:transposase